MGNDFIYGWVDLSSKLVARIPMEERTFENRPAIKIRNRVEADQGVWEMICKDDDVCSSCFLRRKHHDCGHEPFGWGPDMDGEFGGECGGRVSESDLINSRLNDVLTDYHGIGDPFPWGMLYPILIWSGMNWLDHCESEASRSEMGMTYSNY